MKNLLRKIAVKSNWKSYRFEQIASSITERVDPTKTDLEVYIGLEHLDSNTIHISRIGQRTDVEGEKLRFYPGDVIFGRRRAYQRKAAIATVEGFCSAHALVLRANPSVIDPKLFPFFLHSDTFMHRAVDISVGSLSPTINWGTLKNEVFLLPPKEEQAKIAELLWAANNVIETTHCLRKQTLELLTRSISSFINPKIEHDKLVKSEWGFIPKHWFAKKVEEVCLVDYGISESVANNHDSDIGCPIITGANITLDGDLDLTNVVYHELPSQERFLLKKADLLFNWRSGSPLHVGKTAFFNLDETMTYASFVLRIRCKQGFNPKFGYYWFNYLRREGYFVKGMSQQVNFKMNANVIRDLVIPIPPMCEQESLVRDLDLIVEQEKALNKHIASSDLVLNGLINKVFS